MGLGQALLGLSEPGNSSAKTYHACRWTQGWEHLLPGADVCISGVKEPSQSDHSQDSLAVTLPPPATLTAGTEAPLQQQQLQ